MRKREEKLLVGDAGDPHPLVPTSRWTFVEDDKSQVQQKREPHPRDEPEQVCAKHHRRKHAVQREAAVRRGG